ncbi:MAG: hypothetical protein HKL99_10440 [Burkholderiales bacterium]|nr:hypothetical protein [Burkholderiales bacterium]
MADVSSTSELVSMARYWQRTLLDADLKSVKATPDGRNVNATLLEIQSGVLREHQVKAIFETVPEQKVTAALPAKTAPTPASASTKPRRERLRVIVVPFLIASKAEDQSRRKMGSAEKVLAPLVIPALLEEETGALSRRAGEPPWVAREYLEPVGGSGLVIGSQDELDHYLTATEIPGDGDQQDPAAAWGAWYAYAEGMLPKDWKERIEQQGYAIVPTGGRVFPDEDVRGVNQRLISVYDAIRATPGSASALFGSYASHADEPQRDPLPPEKWNTARHVGHVNAVHPLSVSQRVAIAHALATPQGALFPLNGPPGTGKTTWLHALWSSLWVKAAIDGEERPPLIVVSSTNNQAVTNVQESLAKDVQEPRWLPTLPSAAAGQAIDLLGIYIPSSTKVQEAAAKGMRVTSPQMDYFNDFEQASGYTSAARAYWLQEFRKACPAPKVDTVEEGIAHLRATMQRLSRLTIEVIDSARLANAFEAACERRYAAFGGIAQAQAQLVKAKHEASQREQRWATAGQRWDAYLGGESIWQGVFGFLPSIRTSRGARDRAALRSLGIEVAALPGEHAVPSKEAREAVVQLLAQRLEQARAKHASVGEALSKSNDDHARLMTLVGKFDRTMRDIALDQDLQSWLPAASQALVQGAASLRRQDVDEFDVPTGLQPWLDRTLRHAMFRIAVHYWEGRWTAEVERVRAANALKKPTPDWRKAAWGRRAMLTPCFVTTMHTGSGVFTCRPAGEDWQPHWGVIDWLVVDEAGQIAPEIAGPMMALAQRAVTVGDRKQIPPVWSVSDRVDAANARRLDVAADAAAYERLADQSMASASGSVLGIAQRRSPWRAPGMPETGLYLLEHRRCVDPVIAYCNELSYAGRIQPKRGMTGIVDGHPWPHMGFAHVPGECETVSGSRRNVFEARMIASWLKRESETIRKHYGKATLGECVAIITPFALQKASLLKEMDTAFGRGAADVGNLTVGTVHSMQGAERALIIFSSVYSAGGDAQSYFFDKMDSVLNVAVSRARDSFLVFGDIGIFRPTAQTASGLLARHLMKDRGNEIVLSYTDVRREDLLEPNSEPTYLYDLVDHQKALTDCIDRAQGALTIVSPWVTMPAITTDALPEKMRAAADRGVDIVVYADDRSLRTDAEHPRKRVDDALSQLREAGVKVIRVTDPLHAKMLLVDDAQFVEGSFNWLSASRDDQYAKFESSVSYAGPRVAAHIEKARSLLSQLAQLSADGAAK